MANTIADKLKMQVGHVANAYVRDAGKPYDALMRLVKICEMHGIDVDSIDDDDFMSAA